MSLSTDQHTFFGLTFLSSPSTTGSRVFISRTTIPPGDKGPPPHLHKYEDESFYILSGKLHLLIENVVHKLSAGDFFTVPKNTIHTWMNETETPVSMLVIFDPGQIDKMFIDMDANPNDIIIISKKYGTIFYNNR